MRLLVFQHIPVEHPGILRNFLAADDAMVTTVELDAGEAIPPLDGYDALWVMGGPMDVWQEDLHPWLVAEKAAIREWVSAGRPYLGVCLGHQLLAAALGGKVAPGTPEVGILPIALTEAGMADPLFQGFPPTIQCLQWHAAAVVEPPAGATVLARSDACPVQAIRVGTAAYGIQYHVEATHETVPEWGCVPEYAEALERQSGPGALERFRTATDKALPELNAAARRLYDNFRALLRQSADR